MKVRILYHINRYYLQKEIDYKWEFVKTCWFWKVSFETVGEAELYAKMVIDETEPYQIIKELK